MSTISLWIALFFWLDGTGSLAGPKPEAPDAVCFSPAEECDQRLISWIRAAQASLDIAVFDLNLDQLAHHLLLQSRKIKVRVLVDRRQAKGEHSLVPLLVKAGVPVRFGKQRGLMHNKFALRDQKTLQTGSFNYTNGASFKNAENQVYLSDPKIVQRFQMEFEKLWEAGVPVRPENLKRLQKQS